MAAKSVLISGIGVAGPTLAYWLERHGFAPTLVDNAPALRTGGYVIDFWGLGYDIADRMGLIPAIDRIGYHARELRVVGERGQRLAGFGTRVMTELTAGRYVTVARSDLSRLLFGTIEHTCEAIFGDEIIGLREEGDQVRVQFREAGERGFDFVVGADGMHSAVRQLVFGSEDRFETRLGYTVAAFEVEGYRPRDEEVYIMYGMPGRQLARFALHGDRTLFLFILGGTYDVAEEDIGAQKAIICAEFKDGGWECGRVLSELDRAGAIYFDRVSQIRMDGWSQGRVALIGDAAFCVSLLAGQRSALAMISAYVLAGELAKAQGEHALAFERYESLLRPFIAEKQRGAARFASSFAPRTRFGLAVRNAVLNSFRIPGLARLALGRDLNDRITLPDYAA